LYMLSNIEKMKEKDFIQIECQRRKNIGIKKRRDDEQGLTFVYKL